MDLESARLIAVIKPPTMSRIFLGFASFSSPSVLYTLRVDTFALSFAASLKVTKRVDSKRKVAKDAGVDYLIKFREGARVIEEE